MPQSPARPLESDPDDLSIEQIYPPPCSGMQVAVPPNGVVVTHVPTGISATVIGETSQHKNKALAEAMVQFALNQRLTRKAK
jgi:protein subunit release factor A